MVVVVVVVVAVVGGGGRKRCLHWLLTAQNDSCNAMYVRAHASVSQYQLQKHVIRGKNARTGVRVYSAFTDAQLISWPPPSPHCGRYYGTLDNWNRAQRKSCVIIAAHKHTETPNDTEHAVHALQRSHVQWGFCARESRPLLLLSSLRQ
jgi:hypothetical protein